MHLAVKSIIVQQLATIYLGRAFNRMKSLILLSNPIRWLIFIDTLPNISDRTKWDSLHEKVIPRYLKVSSLANCCTLTYIWRHWWMFLGDSFRQKGGLFLHGLVLVDFHQAIYRFEWRSSLTHCSMSLTELDE
jgi:hypothetical protein